MTINRTRTISIVEDCREDRERLKLIIDGEPDFTCRGDFSDVDEFLSFEPVLKPDLLILDLELGRKSGIDCLKSLLEKGRTYPVYVLTQHDDPQWFFAALESGAMGYGIKGISATKIVETVQALLAGEARIDSLVAHLMRTRFLELHRSSQSVAKLTHREAETLRFLASGMTDREVATELSLSPRTIENRVCTILRKLHANNRAQAIATAVQGGLLSR